MKESQGNGQGSDYQDDPQKIIDIFLSDTQFVNFYKSKVGNITKYTDHQYQQILDGQSKIIYTNQFSSKPHFSIIEFDLESTLLEVWYGNFKIQVSSIVTSLKVKDLLHPAFNRGNFGKIYDIIWNENQYVMKSIKAVMLDGRANLEKIYLQYFMGCIASAFKVGPQLVPVMGYDIVLFADEACFFMEKLTALQKKQLKLSGFEKDMRKNLETIHSIGFVHLDIKPENVAYSQILQKVVLIDFGFSKLIKQPLGRKSLTKFAGTLLYCSQQMRKASLMMAPTYVDLYFNDLKCMLNSMVIIQQAKATNTQKVVNYAKSKKSNLFQQI